VDFERKLQAFNVELQREARKDPRIYCYKHERSLIVKLDEEISTDNIHVTTPAGMRLYNFSIRSAVIKGLRRARELSQ
jgi:hypothetical protein